jgi:NADH:ubiquinone oxidoreductase subunit 3 (subunit A)
MIVGLLLLNKSKIEAQKHKINKENYSSLEAAEAGGFTASSTFYLMIGIIFLVMEIFFILCNINIVFKCTKPGVERIINMFLAIIIPIPYMFGNILLNTCAKETLQSNKLF